MKKEFKDILKEKNLDALPNILFVAAECAPLSKTGGLADVVGTLPQSLNKLGLDARVITPYHRVIKEKYGERVEHLFDFYVELGWRNQYCGIERLEINGVTVYLVDNEFYFGDRIYKGGYEEGEQYAFFSRAVLEALPSLDYKPQILHCNDWHTAMLPMLAKTQYVGRMQAGLKFLLSIHNLAYQGKFGFDVVEDWFGIEKKYNSPEFMELDGCVSFLKAGCVFSDRIATVSPNYAEEIKGSYYGEGLDGILRARKNELSGILNGIDTAVFNPGTDKLIKSNYTKGRLHGKSLCKAELQSIMGLEQRADVPLFAMVTRLTEQKGFELLKYMLDELMQYNDIQILVLGTGDKEYEELLRSAEARYRGRLCAYIGYNEELSHMVYAGADFLLMPSRFEPCGLSQMIAMRYGTLPIVRETGGLKDSVLPYNRYTGRGTGFSFTDFNAHDMKSAMLLAIECYRDPVLMLSLIKQAMSEDFGFERSALEYVRLYLCML